MMPIGAQLRRLREEKRISLNEIARETGLQRNFVRRVEKGVASPSVATLERFAKVLGMPLYELFYPSKHQPTMPHLTALEKLARQKGKAGQEARFLLKLGAVLLRISKEDRWLFLYFAKGLARHAGSATRF